MIIKKKCWKELILTRKLNVDKKLVIRTKPNQNCFDLPENADNNLKH